MGWTCTNLCCITVDRNSVFWLASLRPFGTWSYASGRSIRVWVLFCDWFSSLLGVIILTAMHVQCHASVLSLEYLSHSRVLLGVGIIWFIFLPCGSHPQSLLTVLEGSCALKRRTRNCTRSRSLPSQVTALGRSVLWFQNTVQCNSGDMHPTSISVTVDRLF